jgi:hypothetical protein
MIPELNQPARIASLEYRLAKIPCLPEAFASNLGAASMNFIARLQGWPAKAVVFEARRRILQCEVRLR